MLQMYLSLKLQLLTAYQKGDTFVMREILAYEGPCFTIEWYYDENGISQALDYFNRLGDTFFFMGKKIMKKAKSTFERIMSDPKQKKPLKRNMQISFCLSLY